MTIIKPIKAGRQPVDLVALNSNLETFFQLNYKNYEIMFCFEARDDPAVEVVRKLMSAYPNITAKVLTGVDEVGVNPKINNMLKGYNQSRHPYIWICDQGIRVKKDVLIEMVVLIEQNKRIGLGRSLSYICYTKCQSSASTTVYTSATPKVGTRECNGANLFRFATRPNSNLRPFDGTSLHNWNVESNSEGGS